MARSLIVTRPVESGVQLTDDLRACGVEAGPSTAVGEVLDAGEREAEPGNHGEHDHESPYGDGQRVVRFAQQRSKRSRR
jgi:hypothetical protein